MTDATCSKCGARTFDEAPEKGQPCPICGSMARTMNVASRLEIEPNLYIKTKSKHRDGGRKVVREETMGDDFYRAKGIWNVIHRLIDRAKDWYEETIRSKETGDIIHHCAEPLSKHHGHGSAKCKPPGSSPKLSETLPTEARKANETL